MSPFTYVDGELCAEQVSLSEIATQFGTPCYVYSRTEILRQWQAYDASFGQRLHLVCYAVKANSNLAVLASLAEQGAGFDIVSAGELTRVRAAGGDPAKVIFSGVGKRTDEIELALQAGIRAFNVESAAELQRIDAVAGNQGVRAPVSMRINPDVDADTHPYIATGLGQTKFGIAYEDVLGLYQQARSLNNLEVVGIGFHIGSQITTLAPYLDALERVLELVAALTEQKIGLRHIDTGGGLGVCYTDETPPSPAQLVQAVCKRVSDPALEVIMEPGRSIVANAGVLLTRVEYTKQNAARHFAVVDAAMNDFLRPSLYSAEQTILPVREQNSAATRVYDIVGPVCETADVLGRDRRLPLQPGALLAVCGAGAYGFVMSSNYNARPRPAEVMVAGSHAQLVRARESMAGLLAGEQIWTH